MADHKYIAAYDWKETPEDVMADLKPVLKKMGVFVYEMESTEGSDTSGFILSSKPMTKKELRQYEKAEFGFDDEED